MNYGDLPHHIRDLIALFPLGASLFFFSCIILATFRRKRKILTIALSSLLSLFSFLCLALLVCYDKKIAFALDLINSFPCWLILSFEVALFLSSTALFTYLALRKRTDRKSVV